MLTIDFTYHTLQYVQVENALYHTLKRRLMSHKNYALDLYETKTEGTGSLRDTKWYIPSTEQ